tara:strand:+ start:205 stop:534 length:330 start_codon:yes stop_codon:yes gene_type:complete
MSEPSNISINAAPIYSADLLYEQNCKCGATRVLEAGDEFDYTTAGDKGWKFVALISSELSALSASNVSTADCTKIVGTTLGAGTEIMMAVEGITVNTGLVIVYMDCNQS